VQKAKVEIRKIFPEGLAMKANVKKRKKEQLESADLVDWFLAIDVCLG